MTLGSNDIGIRKSEFVKKNSIAKKSNQKLTKRKYILCICLGRVIMWDNMFFFTGIFTFLIPNVVRL